MNGYVRPVGVAFLGIGLGWAITPLSVSLGGWVWLLPWLLLNVVCSLLTSWLAPKREIVFGLLPNVVGALGMLYSSFVADPEGTANPAVLGPAVILGVFAVLLGLAVSGAVHSWRQS